MDKLEKALTLSLNNYDLDKVYIEDSEEREALESIESISKMKVSKILSEEELLKLKIVCPESPQKKLVDQLRDIRTEINKKTGKNLIMVTSVEDESGVSFISTNLAAVTAFDSTKSSLLVDCKMSDGSIKEKFSLDGTDGLTDYIFSKEIEDENIIHDVGIDRFRVVHAGKMKAKSAEYFTHPKFKKLLNSLKNRYQDRLIFMDAPPILNSADARILLGLCDLVILVLPRGKISNKKLASVSSVIPQEKMLGVVINNYIY